MLLIDKLIQFSNLPHADLDSEFRALARHFLYGGYVSVRDDDGRETFRVHIRTVEFYFHSEDGSACADEIVYHRNGKGLADMPYFPLMAFNAHVSGIDITFENRARQYRASALIRAYEVVDMRREEGGVFLKYSKKDGVGLFRPVDPNAGDCVNTQSTYIFDIINGFGPHGPQWMDNPLRDPGQPLVTAPRKGVRLYVNHQRTKDPDTRKWSFTRPENLTDL